MIEDQWVINKFENTKIKRMVTDGPRNDVQHPKTANITTQYIRRPQLRQINLVIKT